MQRVARNRVIAVCSLAILLIATTVEYASANTRFVRCSVLGTKECLQLKISSVAVSIGKDGTDEDVSMRICSDLKATSCCETPALKSLLSDDWSRNSVEVWKPKYLGACAKHVFKVKSGLTVTLRIASLNDPLIVKSMELRAIDSLPVKKGGSNETQTFKCPRMVLKNKAEDHQNCVLAPYRFARAGSATFKVGLKGTKDKVQMKICSDVNGVCCEAKLSRLLRKSWQPNHTETWQARHLGKCKDKIMKVNRQPIVTMSKNGHQDLTVRAMTLDMTVVSGKAPTGRGSAAANKQSFVYSAFSLMGQCDVQQGRCTTQLTPGKVASQTLPANNAGGWSQQRRHN